MEPVELHYQKNNDILVKAGSRLIPLSLFILILASLFFIPQLFPLFKPGPPINSDIGVHYSLAACLHKTNQWPLPTSWCTHGQAGLARLQRYALLNQWITSFIALVFPLDISFKLTMVLLFLMLPIGAYALLKWIGYPLAGSLAFALFLFEPGGKLWGGYALHFVITGFISNAAASFSPLTILSIIWMLSHPKPIRVVIASIVASLHFLAHPGGFMWLPIAGIPIIIFYRFEVKENWKRLLFFPLLLAFFLSFWWIPALFKSSYFLLPGIGGQFITEPTISKHLLALSTAQLRFIIVGILSSLYLSIFGKKRDVRIIAAIPSIIALVWIINFVYPGFWYFKYFMIDRSAYEIRTFLFLSTALVLGGHHPKKLSGNEIPSLMIGIIIACAFIVPFHSQEAQWSKNVFTGNDIERSIIPAFRIFDTAQGRILAENTYLAFPGTINISQFWSLSAAYSDKEFLGNSDFWYTADDYSSFYKGFLFYKNLSNYSDDELFHLFSSLNVEYIVVFSPQARKRFSNIPSSQWDAQFSHSDVELYRTRIDHSYLSFPNGSLDKMQYNQTRALAHADSDNGGILFFKVRQWPNWKAWIDGTQTPVRKGAFGLMEIDVPPGSHDIQFEYGLIFIDILGYIVTLAGIVIAMYWVKINRCPPVKNSGDTTSGNIGIVI